MGQVATRGGREREEIVVVGTDAIDRADEVTEGLRATLEKEYPGRFAVSRITPGEDVTVTARGGLVLAAVGQGDILYNQLFSAWCDVAGVPVEEYRITPDHGPEQVVAAIGLVVQGMIGQTR